MAHNQQHQYRSPFGDTTYTKVFVGGLAWETPTEKMRAYFEQFGDILEAVIICDKSTGKSKGYGFVTFKDPASAASACVDSNPMIDGRRANCNIASFGRPRPSPPRGRGQGQSSSSTYGGTAGLPTPQQTLPPQFFYHPYGYSTYPAYGYQGVYNPQQLQMQQYAQMQMQQYYGVGGSTSSSSTMEGPYYYGGGYAARGAAYGSTTPAQRISAPSYVYYPTHMEGAYTPYPTTTTTTSTNLGPFSPPNFPSSSTLSPFAPPPTRHQIASSSAPGELQGQQSNTEETEAVTIRPAEGPTSST